jgi:hypothetical protein
MAIRAPPLPENDAQADIIGGNKAAVLILADNRLRRSGYDGKVRILERHAIDILLHHDDSDQHDGRRDAAEYKPNDSKAATVGHDPLPQHPLRFLVGRTLSLVQAIGLTFPESLSSGSIDKPGGRAYGRFEA